MPTADEIRNADRTVRLLVQFEGTDFHGWQLQKGVRTVQLDLGEAIASMVQHPVTLHASSRTDAGVHARGLPVTFRTLSTIPTYGLIRGINSRLPSDVSVVEAVDKPGDYWVRGDSVAKTYTYRILLGYARKPLLTRFAWHLGYGRLDVEAMREAAKYMVGEHDFAAFRAQGCQARSTTRRMYAVDVSEPDDEQMVTVTVIGNAFLRNMVRIMVGTLVKVGLEREAPTWVADAIASGDRTKAGVTAPACGLTLTRVHFEGYPRLTADKFPRRANPLLPSAPDADEVPCNP